MSGPSRMTESETTTDKDLPMSANVTDISVNHFILDLKCKLELQVFEGSVVLFCCQAQPSSTATSGYPTHKCTDAERSAGYGCDSLQETIIERTHSIHVQQNNTDGPCIVCRKNASDLFKMVLDCHKLDIQRVEGIFLHEEYKTLLETDPGMFAKRFTDGEISMEKVQHHRQAMEFSCDDHCVRVFMQGVSWAQDFPNAVQIWYSTQPSGPSLKWTKDQDNNPCVFTIGHFLSNRSLFPSQDIPTALLTWQASVMVTSDLTVLMTGDREPLVTVLDGGIKKYSYYTSFPMPSCTFALAVGSWKCEHLASASEFRETDPVVPPVRLYAPDCLRERTTSLLSWYLPLCFVEVQRILGVYPFHRLDILIVPACFDSMGLASPSLLFLSQSILCPDGSLCARVAHELCHTWFGIVMGPLDWTEEWLTEGFCTYLEDLLHTRVCQMGAASVDYMGLRKELNLRTLKAELENTDQDLQTLRPNKGKSDGTRDGKGETRFLKNGMNPEKKFMQVHYLKGYFLLHTLEDLVGRETFLIFLQDYVKKFIYQLVTSQDFLGMFFSQFHAEASDKGLTQESVYADWLDCPGMPQALCCMSDDSTGQLCTGNGLRQQVFKQLSAIKEECRKYRQRKKTKKLAVPEVPQLEMLTPTQVILLFDYLLEEDRLPGHILDQLKEVHGSHFMNAEVCHRWCELIIKHKHRKFYTDVGQFLVQHQAMGVYLYGEAMISRCPAMAKIVKNCFLQLRHDMPDAVVQTVSAMLFPT